MSASRVILLGPPGAGKGTQAERLCAEHGLLHVSTGELLRAAVAEGTALGVQAKGYMDAGELVPDDLVCALVAERLAQDDAEGGFLLDGFPRNVAQARALEEQLGGEGPVVDRVVHMQLDDDEIVRRLLARGRKDDTEPVIRKRLEVYSEETRPLVAYYREKGLVRTVEAKGSVEEIQSRIGEALADRGEVEAS